MPTPSVTRIVPPILLSVVLTACGGGQQEIQPGETEARVPQLDEVHEFMYPLWHDAFPGRDLAAVREITPQMQPAVQGVLDAQLPGILRDKQERWDQGLERLETSYETLQEAAATADTARVMDAVEEFHTAYEALVRIVRPLVPELEAYHQALYELYHYAGPEGDLERMRSLADTMSTRLAALHAVELPSRLAQHQEAFGDAVRELDLATRELVRALGAEDIEAARTELEQLHSAYQSVEAIFD